MQEQRIRNAPLLQALRLRSKARSYWNSQRQNNLPLLAMRETQSISHNKDKNNQNFYYLTVGLALILFLAGILEQHPDWFGTGYIDNNYSNHTNSASGPSTESCNNKYTIYNKDK